MGEVLMMPLSGAEEWWSTEPQLSDQDCPQPLVVDRQDEEADRRPDGPRVLSDIGHR